MNRFCSKMAGYKGLLSSVFVVAVFFFAFFVLLVPIKFDNLGGTHSWLSGSTIKFVNYWLEEGPMELNFTNYEYPASVEFGDGVEERVPYLSYPTGETFVVYTVARLAGKQEISVSFLHKLQVGFYALEAVLLTIFVYLFLGKTLKYRSEWKKSIVATSSGILWMLMPTCSYYLANVFFADQLIILFVMAFIVVEYLFRLTDKNDKRRRVGLKILRAVILFFGVIIDYYFWILALVAFVFEIVDLLVRRKEGFKFRGHPFWNVFFWYGVPVIFALIVYVLQLSATDGWARYLMDVFFTRSAGNDKYNLSWQFNELGKNFANAFTLDPAMTAYLVLLILVLLGVGVVYIIRQRRIKAVFMDPGFSVILMNIVAIIMQLFILKQHSAVHEFSMMKVAWLISLLPLLSAITYKKFFWKDLGKVDYLYFYTPSFIVIMLVTGVPISTIQFIETHVQVVDYSAEWIIKNNTVYNDVVFSFTKSIEYLPPQSLAISHKPVWKINGVERIDEKFGNLDASASKVLFVEKGVELENDLVKSQACLVENGKKRYEDEWYMLIELNDIKKCERRK